MLTIGEVTAADARDFASWRYDGDPDDPTRYLDPTWAYRTVRDESGRAVGHCCFGADARVPGGCYAGGDDQVIDVGGGLRPELTGRGRGSEFLAAVFAEAERIAPGARLRVTIAAFNQRALRLVRRLGFCEDERFTSAGPEGRAFVVLVRPAR
ncbi:MAG TPA: GNAT family N-acetyltransferase [Kofleriaceae bacterium]|nr:GNAT family N-acetyltransferase [Kofleriaceae bacterium]